MMDAAYNDYTLYQIVLPYACFGIEVGTDGIVVGTAPIGKWMKGELIVDIREWVRRKGGSIVQL